MDRKLVASKQVHEIKAICKAVNAGSDKKIKVAELKEVMATIAKRRKNYKPGEFARSRTQIYAELRLMGFTTPGKKK